MRLLGLLMTVAMMTSFAYYVTGQHCICGDPIPMTTAVTRSASSGDDGGGIQGPPGKRGAKGEKGKVGEKGEVGGECDNERLMGEIVKVRGEVAGALNELESWKKATRLSFEKLGMFLCEFGIGDRSVVADYQLSASSYWGNQDNHSPRHGRLRGSTGIGGWVRHASNTGDKWIQVDLLRNHQITGVVTQGRLHHHDQWVTSYTMSYRVDGESSFAYVIDSSGGKATFIGNEDRNTAKKNLFAQPVTARYFRLHPTAWHAHPTVRFELLTC